VIRQDINTYANDLLIEFLDAFHVRLKELLEGAYAGQWFERGVRPYLPGDLDGKTRSMLENPMRVVDMGKASEELFGVEHLSKIVAGNWKPVFRDLFQDKKRTDVYLDEIREMRHNLAHRRGAHVLQMSELGRFTGNCAVLLRALQSEASGKFEAVSETIYSGQTPWGSSLGGRLPASDEIVQEFVGRTDQMRYLAEWLAGEFPQLLVWGYGGAGKSALAYAFAREMKASAPSDLNAIAWVSAKRREYVEGIERGRRADFSDKAQFVAAAMAGIYEVDFDEDFSERDLLEHLNDAPVLLIVDDIDTVLEDDELVEFLVHDVRSTRSRVLYTSRQKVTGIRSVEVLGFEDEELRSFVAVRADSHGLDEDICMARLPAIRSVTDGFPLFIDDLLRYARLTDLDESLSAWSQRKGDAARQYALRRQVEQLGGIPKRVLLALSESDRPMPLIEIATIAGVSDDDTEQAVKSLLDWRLATDVGGDGRERAHFTTNNNTARLVEKTYGSEPEMEGVRSRLKGRRKAAGAGAERTAISSAIGLAQSLAARGDVSGAIQSLKEEMIGDLADSPELHSVLGWAYKRLPDNEKAIAAFERAYELGDTKEDTYYHWASVEAEAAESAIGRRPDVEVRAGWARSVEVAELGVKVCGRTSELCRLAGYARTREAKSLEHLREFSEARRASAEGAAWMERALEAKDPAGRAPSRATLYRGLALAQEGAEDWDGLKATLIRWRRLSSAPDRDLERLSRKVAKESQATVPVLT
jgi:tetratricopeptide (TPR) repeat protein